MLKMALPSKGALSEEAIRLIKEAGYQCSPRGREQFVIDADNEIEFCFIRPRDIAVYVNSGIFSAGITGRDLALDSKCSYNELLPLGFGKSSFCYAVPRDSGVTNSGELEGSRIATSYVSLVEQDLTERGVQADVVRLDGAVEIAVRLGVADAVADVVQSGRTLEEAGLRILEEPVLESEGIFIVPEQKEELPEGVQKLANRIEGVLLARRYMIVEYDIARTRLNEACAVTPGIESPTVSPLNEEGWVAVKSMIKRSEVNTVMDELSRIGAKGILVSDVKACRL